MGRRARFRRFRDSTSFWILLSMVGFILTFYALIWFSERTKLAEDIKKHVYLWEIELAKAIHHQNDQNFVRKVISGLKNYGVSRVEIQHNGLTEFTWQEPTASDMDCDIEVNLPLTIVGLSVADLKTCVPEMFLIRSTLMSPWFIGSALIGLLAIMLTTTVPLFNYRRSMLHFLTSLKQWSGQSSHVLQPKGSDELANELVSLVHQGTMSRVQLEIARGELEVTKEINQISRQVGHDIRSPVSALKVVAHAAKGLTQEERQLIERAIRRIEHISRDLLHRTTRRISAQPIFIAGIVQQVVQEKRTVQYGIDISFDTHSARKVMVLANPDSLSRMIANILQNSIEAQVPGRRLRITIKAIQQNGMLNLAICDNGEGIDASVISRVGREEFSYNKQGGSGLGLSHAKYVLESWGGELLLSSQAGEGTEVTLSLRIQQVLTERSEMHLVQDV